MARIVNLRLFSVTFIALGGCILAAAGGCATAPKVENEAKFVGECHVAKRWFCSSVAGLREQIDRSAGYIIFPNVGQYGMLITGGKFGRGMLNRSNDSQIGWAYVNTASIGLQVGVQGFKMLIVLEDTVALEKFKSNQLDGSVSGIVLAGEAGGSKAALFDHGVAIYQGANTGLMAGVNVGLDYVRYKPLEE